MIALSSSFVFSWDRAPICRASRLLGIVKDVVEIRDTGTRKALTAAKGYLGFQAANAPGDQSDNQRFYRVDDGITGQNDHRA